MVVVAVVVKAVEVETAVERMGAGGSTAGEVPDVEGSDRTFPHWLCHLLGRRSVPGDLNKNINTILRIFIKTLKKIVLQRLPPLYLLFAQPLQINDSGPNFTDFVHHGLEPVVVFFRGPFP